MLLHGGQAALALDVLQHQTHDVNGVGGRGVIHRALIGLDLVIESRGGDGQGVVHQIVAHNDHGHARGPHVFLCACINDAIARHIQRRGHDVGRHVSHQWHLSRVGCPVALHPADGFVAAEMHIRGIGRQAPLVLRGHAQKPRVLAARRQMGLAVFARLLHGLLRPNATHHIVGMACLAHQVHGQDGVFCNCPSL